MAYLGRQESQEIASDHIRTSKPSSHVLSNHKLDSNKQRNRTISILCVGDSLTAGVTVMGHSELNKPYAPFLQGFLRKNHTNNDHSITITHKGFPGWTSVDLIRGKRGLDNLTTILSRPRNRNIDILVIQTCLQTRSSTYHCSGNSRLCYPFHGCQLVRTVYTVDEEFGTLC